MNICELPPSASHLHSSPTPMRLNSEDAGDDNRKGQGQVRGAGWGLILYIFYCTVLAIDRAGLHWIKIQNTST
jgi:hypothetical protein